MTKKCKGCEQEKPLDQFSKHYKRGYQNRCKTCRAEYNKNHYQENKKSYLTRARISNDATKQKLIAIIEQEKNKPCPDCGNSYPPYVMDFDHVRGVKFLSVSKMVTYTERKLRTEIAKCEVVCSNCHRIRTHNRRRSGTNVDSKSV